MLRFKVTYMDMGVVKGYIFEIPSGYGYAEIQNKLQTQYINLQDVVKIERIFRPDPVDIFDETTN